MIKITTIGKSNKWNCAIKSNHFLEYPLPSPPSPPIKYANPIKNQSNRQAIMSETSKRRAFQKVLACFYCKEKLSD
jgi:hypothetical protein